MSKSATQCAYSSYRRRRYSRERTSYSLGVWGIDTPSPLPTRSWVNRRNEYRSGNRRYGKEHDAGTRGRDSDPRMRAARDGRQMPPTDLREARLRLRVVLISEHVRFTTTQAALTWKVSSKRTALPMTFFAPVLLSRARWFELQSYMSVGKELHKVLVLFSTFRFAPFCVAFHRP